MVFDIGNSRIKIGFFIKGVLKNIAGFNTEVESWKLKKAIKELIGEHEIKKVLVSNVTDRKVDFLDTLKCKIVFLDSQTNLPITLRYKTPETIGADRIALACAVYNESNSSKLVIDVGTCITYDFINSKAEYLGGGISPGIDIRLKSLAHFTKKLPLSSKVDFSTVDKKVSLIGRTTQEAIKTGVLYGIQFEILGVINQYTLQYGKNMEVFLTGGDLIFFDLNIKNMNFTDANLLLKGLNKILEYQQSSCV